MLNLLIFILIAYGATNIMIYGSIFEGWRTLIGVYNEKKSFFGKLFGCFMCLSFWWGVILSLTLFSPTLTYIDLNFTPNVNKYLSLFFDACLTSGGVWLINSIQDRLER